MIITLIGGIFLGVAFGLAVAGLVVCYGASVEKAETLKAETLKDGGAR